MSKCDDSDGLKDNVIADPWGCKIDFEAYKCISNSDQDCFTNAQIKVIPCRKWSENRFGMSHESENTLLEPIIDIL